MQQLKPLDENNTPSNTKNTETMFSPKDLHAASKSGGQTEISIEIKVMTLIEKTIQNLSVYNEKSKTWLNTDQTHLEIS